MQKSELSKIVFLLVVIDLVNTNLQLIKIWIKKAIQDLAIDKIQRYRDLVSAKTITLIE